MRSWSGQTISLSTACARRPRAIVALDATIEWSYNSLSVDEQTLFRRLCVLRDAFDLELAARVGDFEHGVMLNHLKHWSINPWFR